jgi:SHS2 domain-containing protein
MPYRYLEEIAKADVAFEAWGATVEELFLAAGDATMNIMVADLGTIAKRATRTLLVKAETLEMLLFELLQELIFYKDAERLLLRLEKVEISCPGADCSLRAEAAGEELNPEIHDLVVDVKAVTLHRFRVLKDERGWQATVILDI